MDIKNYLQYYIGHARFRYRYFDYADDEWGIWVKLTPKRYLQVTDDNSISAIQLELRPLEDMTQEEMKQIWKIVFNRAFNGNNIIWIDKESTFYAKRWVLSSGVERLGIEMSGQVWADSDLHHYKYNPYFVTHFLFTKGFDIFGLIPAGLAVKKQNA